MIPPKKFIKIFLYTILLVPVLLFTLNYLLANRLEKYLKKELISRVSDATNHFYVLSYDDLSINLLNGELDIEGITFKPDSNTFRQWESADSLPQIYLNAKVDRINFTGVNLIWRWSYKQLNFKTFEIQSPQLELFNAYHSSNHPKKSSDTNSKTLYELIEPYIKVLSVQVLNLENASVSYKVENPISPIIYKLDDVSFHAYDFRLDSLSSRSGKLLYADNFDFITNRNQTLFINNEFMLSADSIRLSTKDSTIYLVNIHLQPQDTLWKNSKKKLTNNIDGHISNILVDGISFKRENWLNYLEANNFSIYDSYIKIFQLADNNLHSANDTKTSTDSIIQSLSLYQMISPILHRVAVEKISLEKTQADYFYGINDSIETYHIDNLDFHAYHFAIDSASESKHNYWYSDYFTLEANGMVGLLKARNHQLSIDHVKLNTGKGSFEVEKMLINPISINTKNDYLKGNIKSVNIKGLIYDKGISAKLFKIESPDIQYVKASDNNKEAPPKGDNKSQVDIQSLFNPILNYLSIQHIEINNANVSFLNKNLTDPMTYQINEFNFFATDFLMSEKTTKRKENLFFDYKDFGFDLHNFDNYMLNKEYKLTINTISYSTVKSKFVLENVALIPQKKSGLSIHLNTPLIEMTNPNWEINMEGLKFDLQSVAFDNFNIENADITLNNNGRSYSHKIKLALEGGSYDNQNQIFDIKDISFNTSDVNIPLDNGFYNLYIKSISLINKDLKLGDIHLVSPYSKEEFAYIHPKHTDWLDISADNFSLKNIDISSSLKNKTLIAENAVINKCMIQNYKNRQIHVPKKVIPMIYETIQKAPFKIDINTVAVNDMQVVYEELAPKGTVRGKLLFTDMNGIFHGFTNIVKQPGQYIRLDAEAKLMGEGPLTASWFLPVDSLNDHFRLNAHLQKYDLQTLNELITPLAPVRIKTGKVDDLTLTMNASSLGASINMKFLYNDLTIDYLTEKEGIPKKQKAYSTLINTVIRNNNPRHEHSKPHIVDIKSIKRDPYHSTFNYLWQILRPAMADAVGVSYTEQKVATEIKDFFNDIKSIFYPESKKVTEDKK